MLFISEQVYKNMFPYLCWNLNYYTAFSLTKIIHLFSDGQIKSGKLVQIPTLLLCGASVCTTLGVVHQGWKGLCLGSLGATCVQK